MIELSGRDVKVVGDVSKLRYKDRAWERWNT